MTTPANLNMAEVKPKSSWGGRRPGAGRAPQDGSIRQDLAKARAGGYKHSYTRYEVERERFISEHGCSLLCALTLCTVDKDNKVEGKRLFSINAAWQIAHFAKADQPFWLAQMHPEKLWHVWEKWRDREHPALRAAAILCYQALEEAGMLKYETETA